MAGQFNLGLSSSSEESMIKDCIEVVLSADNSPALICCSCGARRGAVAHDVSSSGVHQSGIVVGCLRRLCGWNLASALLEVCPQRLALSNRCSTAPLREPGRACPTSLR